MSAVYHFTLFFSGKQNKQATQMADKQTMSFPQTPKSASRQYFFTPPLFLRPLYAHICFIILHLTHLKRLLGVGFVVEPSPLARHESDPREEPANEADPPPALRVNFISSACAPPELPLHSARDTAGESGSGRGAGQSGRRMRSAGPALPHYIQGKMSCQICCKLRHRGCYLHLRRSCVGCVIGGGGASSLPC